MSADRPLILLVEDEPAQREILAYNLRAEDYEVFETDRGDEVMSMIADLSPDVVVLDWMLPGLSGIEICRMMKARGETRSIPVIMLSARSSEADKVRGLETGADDYMVKPYSVVELVARIRTQLRRSRPSAAGTVLVYDDITLDPETHKVTRDGSEIALGPTEFRLLTTLMERPGRVWTRDQLLDRVWGRDIFVDTRTVDVHIGRLRKSLGIHGGVDHLRTVRGTGYALG
ncbi:phosphate regulon transcriptional regulator PhoB [Profundibacterium mesophilum]|uniref:Phosphate regulon transcriptional regulatory protein PhoB n=1 Tax=Profundibacterium mesophilum KAUST100406-0324 TaxID=1037889 RepID=A0A921TC71_9RHOB|nr:phosphate regulon transcriptional regulator PhoB [Profundibacterium mesophilum]KAF0674761.1 Phosphate regulon transcriptional regulator PhoR [Profundibacterium mesophilum KAUST100406-0324]